MRIAYVAPFGLRPKGTTSARVMPMARVLAGMGAQVRVIIPPWDDPPRAGQRRHEHGVEVVHTGAPRTPLEVGAVLWQALREIRRFEPDVVHCFKPIGYSGAIAFVLTTAAHNSNGPLVVVDTDDLEGPSGWSRRLGPGLNGAVRGAQEAATLRRAPRVTVASAWLRDYVLRLGRSPETVLYLPNGHEVDLDADALLACPPAAVPAGDHAVRTEDAGPGEGVLVWYTRFTEARPERAVPLLARILDAVPCARVVIVGEPVRPGDAAHLAAALASAGLDDRVTWRGYDETALADLRAAGAAVAIYPLDDDETNRARCPAKVPQLMALGMAIVAEAVGEVPAYLAGFDDPCLVAPGDADAFAAKVARLLGEPELRAAVGDRLRAGAARWRWDRVAGGLLEWYRSAVMATTHERKT